jgi:hypothetical protein
MGHEQNALGDVGPELADEVSQMERISVARHMVEFLDQDRVGAGPQMREYPVTGASMSFGVGDTIPKVHLRLYVRESGSAIELQRRFSPATATEEQTDGNGGGEYFHHRT